MPLEEVAQGKITQAELDRLAKEAGANPSGGGNPFPTTTPTMPDGTPAPEMPDINEQIRLAFQKAQEQLRLLSQQELLKQLEGQGAGAAGYIGLPYDAQTTANRFRELYLQNPDLQATRMLLDSLRAEKGGATALRDLKDDAERIIRIAGTNEDKAKYLGQKFPDPRDVALHQRQTAMGEYDPSSPSSPHNPKTDLDILQAQKRDLAQRKATEQRFRQETASPILLPGTPRKYTNQQGTVVEPTIGPDGQAILDESAEGAPPGAPQANAQAEWLAALEGKTTGEVLHDGLSYTSTGYKGAWVFVGFKTVTDQYGQTYRQAVYAPDTEMYTQIQGFEKKDMVKFQKSLGLAQTGYADPDTIKVWFMIVDETSRRNAAGQNVTVDQVYAQIVMANKEALARGGGGGGGGRGGGGNIDISSAKSILSSAMKEYAGREPSDAEVRVFWKKLQSQWSATSGNMDPGQFATDYVRSSFGSETEGMQTNQYYEAMLSVLGGG